MERVADYMIDSEENLKERIGDIMGGKVLELETDKILELGRNDIVNIGLHFFHKDVRLYAASCSEV